MANDRSSTDTTIDPANWADAAYLEDLAQWADAAVELFPVHGERFQEIARVLRAGTAQAPTEAQIERGHNDPTSYTGSYSPAQTSPDPDAWMRDDGSAATINPMTAAQWKAHGGYAIPLYTHPPTAAQAALNPGMREALERIRDFPIGGRTAAGAMALIARQALASLPPSQ